MRHILLAILFSLSLQCIQAQSDSTEMVQMYRLIKTDGGELIGQIRQQDKREILFLTVDKREIYVPQHVVRELIPLDQRDFNNQGKYVGKNKFATRYFITTNGLPIEKGEHYVQWNLFGPNFQFGLDNNLGVGIMTSWVGIPLIATIKKSWVLGDKSQFAIGALAGTGSWIDPSIGGALPFASVSFGDRKRNISFSGGYGAIWQSGDTEGSPMFSVAGMTKISEKISFVFDSFILLPGEDYVGIFIPGLRWHQGEGKAFQFGFVGVIENSTAMPIPIPTVQWYRTL